MPQTTRNKAVEPKLAPNNSIKKVKVSTGNTNSVVNSLNDTSKLSSKTTNKQNVSSLISPSKKFGHKKTHSAAFNCSDHYTHPVKAGRGPKIGFEGSG